MSSPGRPDADASRPRSGILTPTSDSSVHRHRAAQDASSEPRRRDESSIGAMDQLLKPPIAVKPHPPDLHVKPRTLQPILLLPRDHFALGHIDLGNPCGDLPLSRFFECRVKILELEGRMGTSSSVVIARSDSKPVLYALERQPTGLYVVCKLGSWVETDELAQHATVVCQERMQPAEPTRKRPAQDASLDKAPVYKEHKQKRAAIEAIQSLVRKRPRSSTSASVDAPIKAEPFEPTRCEEIGPGQHTLPVPTAAVESAIAGTPTVMQESLGDCAPALAPPTAETILETIRSQYFEALYKSMGSLAYFAKGPLSRARSAFHLDLDTNLDMSDLIEFLKSMLLTTIQVDKKYRETVPEILSKPAGPADSSDEGKRKKKRAKKMKLGKNGLYPNEDEMLQKWWSLHKPELRDDETSTSPAEMRSHIALLRTRETQLQMILILEILALEPLKLADGATDSVLPDLPGAMTPLDAMAPPAPKKRSKHNLPVLLDVHADRLTIWQSTAFDDHIWSTESQAAAAAADNQPDKQASSEPLRDFCVDVIVPFFSARLPQQCDIINKKLGGPVIVSPPKKSKQSSSSKNQKPGSVAKRQLPTKQPRTLQRALSTDLQHRRSVSRGPTNALALLRSASSTAIAAGVKREGSEPVTTVESDSVKQGHGILSRSSSMTNVRNPRAEKKALVEAELKDAISALRKPNREVVGKAMEEAAQHKVPSSKKLKKPSRSSMSAVQVEATPANNRFRDVLATRSDNIADVPLISTEDAIPPSSVGQPVPSTARKAMPASDLVSASPFGAAIGSTPVKTSASSSFLRRPGGGSEMAIPPSSPLVGRKVPTIQQRLSASSSTANKNNFGLSQSRDISLFMTPVKKAAAPIDMAATENIGPSPLREIKKTSIYDRLGWDDDFDDL